MKILHLGGESWLGLLGTDLVIGNGTAPERTVDPSFPVGLLPCLERPYGQITSELKAREHELSLEPGTLLDTIPLTVLPATAVRIQSDYWTALALTWMSSFPSWEVDRGLLRLIETAPWASQATRHHARALRKETDRHLTEHDVSTSTLTMSYDRLTTGDLRGTTQADYLIGIDARTFRITDGSTVIFDEPSFPVVELAHGLLRWLNTPDRGDFEFTSMSADDGLVTIRSSADGWIISSTLYPGTTSNPHEWTVVEHTLRSFLSHIEKDLEASGIPPHEALHL